MQFSVVLYLGRLCLLLRIVCTVNRKNTNNQEISGTLGQCHSSRMKFFYLRGTSSLNRFRTFAFFFSRHLPAVDDYLNFLTNDMYLPNLISAQELAMKNQPAHVSYSQLEK